MRISQKVRVFILLLCLAVTVTCFATSCNDQNDEEEQTAATTAPVQEVEKNATIEDWLPITDYSVNGGVSGVNFLIYDTYNTNYMFIQQEDSEDPLRSEAYSRTQKVQELYSVYLNPIEVTDVPGTLQSSLMGQGGEYDIVYPHPNNVLEVVTNSLSTDLYSYENIHLDQPWWNSSVETFTVDRHLYFAASDYSICGQGLTGLIYNRDLWKKLQLDQKYDITQIVKDGDWTIALLREIAMLYGSDVDGNDKYDLKDQYGMIFQNYSVNGWYWTMGGTVVQKDDNGEYYISIDKDRTQRMGEALYALVFNSDNKVYLMPNVSWGGFSESEGWKAYKTGNSLFMSYEFGALFRHLQEVSFDLGYAPKPKLDAGQEGYPCLCGAGFFLIPRKSADPIRNSILLEALCIESYASFRPTFFRTILLGRLSNLEEDYEMLEMLHESKVYDMGSTWSKADAAGLMGKVTSTRDTNLASFIQGRWKSFLDILDTVEEFRSGIYGETVE